MGEYGRGAKAGFLAGTVSGILTALTQAALFQFYANEVRAALQDVLPSGTTIDQLVTITFYFIVIGSFFAGLIVGGILGLIFSAVYQKYMKSSSLKVKGLVFGLVLWLIGILLGSSGLAYGMLYFALGVTLSLITDLIYGYLLGSFFERFGPKVQGLPGTAAPT